jgi:hypothetical protein
MIHGRDMMDGMEAKDMEWMDEGDYREEEDERLGDVLYVAY